MTDTSPITDVVSEAFSAFDEIHPSPADEITKSEGDVTGVVEQGFKDALEQLDAASVNFAKDTMTTSDTLLAPADGPSRNNRKKRKKDEGCKPPFAKVKVMGYTRTLANGKVVHVGGYVREGQAHLDNMTDDELERKAKNPQNKTFQFFDRKQHKQESTSPNQKSPEAKMREENARSLAASKKPKKPTYMDQRIADRKRDQKLESDRHRALQAKRDAKKKPNPEGKDFRSMSQEEKDEAAKIMHGSGEKPLPKTLKEAKRELGQIDIKLKDKRLKKPSAEHSALSTRRAKLLGRVSSLEQRAAALDDPIVPGGDVGFKKPAVGEKPKYISQDPARWGKGQRIDMLDDLGEIVDTDEKRVRIKFDDGRSQWMSHATAKRNGVLAVSGK